MAKTSKETKIMIGGEEVTGRSSVRSLLKHKYKPKKATKKGKDVHLTTIASETGLSYVVLYNLLTGLTSYGEGHEEEFGTVICSITGLTKDQLREVMKNE